MTAQEKHGYEKHPTTLGKVWHFLAHEDSALSFVADAIIVLIIGKFVVLPLLGLMFGTQFPLVAVVSGSMEHDGSFNQWWFQQQSWYADNNITKEQFMQFPQHDGFNKGDVFIVQGAAFENIKVGDVIVYNIPDKSDPIIHRVIARTNDTLVTKGDANNGQLSFELSVTKEQVKGLAKYKIPYIGWFKVGLVELANLAKR
jgi:signal peptidase